MFSTRVARSCLGGFQLQTRAPGASAGGREGLNTMKTRWKNLEKSWIRGWDRTGAAFCRARLKAEFPLPVTEAGIGIWSPQKSGREEKRDGLRAAQLGPMAQIPNVLPGDSWNPQEFSAGMSCPARPAPEHSRASLPPQNSRWESAPLAQSRGSSQSWKKTPPKNPRMFDFPGFTSQELEKVWD